MLHEMRVLASDYDETLAHEGTVSPRTLEAIRRLRASGRKLVLVTGRRLTDLRRVFPGYAVCDRIVAENGGTLFNPATGEERLLCAPPTATLLERLRGRVTPLFVGRVIVATLEPQRETVQTILRELGCTHHIIMNKDALMVLPTGVDKGSGLCAALAELGISAREAVGVGDAENDDALLSACGLGVAVHNALPALRARAAWTTPGDHGDGIVQLIDRMLDVAPR